MFSLNNKYKINNQNTKTRLVNNVQQQKPAQSSIDILLNKARILKNKLIIEKTKAKNDNQCRQSQNNFQNLNKYKITNQHEQNFNIILSRKVNNISKFKFIQKKTENFNFKRKINQLKLDNRFRKRRKVLLLPKLSLYNNNNNNNLYNISRIKSNVINIKGVKYNLNKDGKKLKRLKSNDRFKINNLIKPIRLNIVQNSNKILEKVIAK
jgi:hypothetical protein